MLAPQQAKAAATGYTDHAHTFSAEEKCGATKGCGGDGYSTHQGTSGNTKCPTCKGNKTVKCSTSSCSTCGGDGIYYTCSKSSSSGTCSYTSATTGTHKCVGNGDNYNTSTEKTHNKTCNKCEGTGYYGKCTRCNGTGKNYKCQNSNCVQNYDADYDNWNTETGYNAVCYTTENTYTIAFNGNGNTSGSTANITNIKYTEAKTLTSNGYERKGYTFLGWSTSSSATTATYTNKQSVSKLSSANGGKVTLYAVWKANTYKMIYKPNGAGGTDVSVEHSYNGTYKVKGADTFIRPGYVFNGWNTKSDGSGVAYTAGASGTCTWDYNVTLYARWKAVDYKVTVNPNGGTYNNNTNRTEHTLSTGSTIDILNPLRIGYTFMGWDIISGDATVTDGEKGKKVTIRSTDVTLTANWKQNSYIVTYDSNGGETETITQTYHYGDAVDLGRVPQKDGYIFVGWGYTKITTTPVTSLYMPDLATSSDESHKDWELTLYAIYSMEVSDVAGHDYPDYTQGDSPEVYLVIWEKGNTDNYRTYPLTYEYDTAVMTYRYSLKTTDVSTFVSGMSEYCYQVVAKDNAGNKGIIEQGTHTPGGEEKDEDPEDFPEVEEYQQTVYHYKKDPATGVYDRFDTTTEMVLEGNLFKPEHIAPPEGYKTGNITYPAGYTITNGSYTVFEEMVSNAYYEPNEYKLTYNANGGSCSTAFKMILYNDYYGELPTPTRRGYTFTGWFTEDGEQVLASHRYTTARNTTVYAHWQVNTYRVTYDYWTNGGTAVNVAGSDVNYGSAVPLTPTATKEGWTFVGWNTEPDATTKITSLTMSDADIVLYAVYKKDITLSIVEQTDSGKKTRTLKKTIYNKTAETDFSLTKVNSWSRWTLLGWTTETDTEGYPQVDVGGIITTNESITFYALYEKPITISYDTAGAALTYESEMKYARYNACGNSMYPTFTLQKAPELSNHSFVKWEAVDGTRYNAQEELVSVTDSIHLKAIWDEYPDLWAYNRHFTLEQARNGDITQTELLSKVTATDKEDGTLEKGSRVVVVGYNASVWKELTTDAVMTVTYEATDSYGNIVSSTITVTVTDTTAKKTNRKTYVRFISKDYLVDSTGALRSVLDGGLEETSVWRTNVSYLNLLKNTLLNTKTDVETWKFTRADIQEMKKHQTQN